VTLRKVPGALVLGLLASLAAHTALYGRQHVIGGAFHAVLIQVAVAGAVSLLALLAALAWAQFPTAADGSVLAARLRRRLPSTGGVFTAALLWYATAEALEPHHAGAPALVLLCLLAAATIGVARLARALTGALARLVVAISKGSFSPRLPASRLPAPPGPIARLLYRAARRYARPPPIGLFERVPAL
jgi:hypothetical protein